MPPSTPTYGLQLTCMKIVSPIRRRLVLSYCTGRRVLVPPSLVICRTLGKDDPF
jgi:hypothetical protein